jgi:hypothetical protein
MLVIESTPGFGASCIFVLSSAFDVGSGAGFGAGFNIGIAYPLQTKPPRVQFPH